MILVFDEPKVSTSLLRNTFRPHQTLQEKTPARSPCDQRVGAVRESPNRRKPTLDLVWETQAVHNRRELTIDLIQETQAV